MEIKQNAAILIELLIKYDDPEVNKHLLTFIQVLPENKENLGSSYCTIFGQVLTG